MVGVGAGRGEREQAVGVRAGLSNGMVERLGA